MKAIIPGTFDPITIGHKALIKRASLLFDEVVVLMCQNFDKTTLFTPDERFEIIKASLEGVPNVKIERHEGWLYEYLKKQEDAVLVKGVRNSNDLEYEKKMADFNLEKSGKETLFFFSDTTTANVSSTLVRELMKSGDDWKQFIPQNAQKLIEKFYKNI